MTTELRFRGDETHASFQAWLQGLKQQGSNILVTGDVPDLVSANAARTLFGDGRRYRILGLIDRTITAPESRLPEVADVYDSRTWVIDQRHGERSVPPAAIEVTSHLEPLQQENVHQLRDEVQTAISFFEEHFGALDPAELRVGVDSLYPLVQRNVPATIQSLRTLTATIRGVSGMAHYHLRVPDEVEIVEDLTPIFDARIELRRRPGMKPEQRWHVPDLEETTVWVEL